MMILSLTVVALLFACLPAAVLLVNLGAFKRLGGFEKTRGLAHFSSALGRKKCLTPSPKGFPEAPLAKKISDHPRPKVSVLIPARDEADKIERTVRAVLANEEADIELLVMDDHSTDQTPHLITSLAKNDSRVRLLTCPPLPEGWCGKQHACWQLARQAKHDTLVWIDADVVLSRDAISRIAVHMDRAKIDLLSGFPKQVTGSWLEQLIVPMIELLILCYFPIRLSRRDRRPSLAIGCGQLMAATRQGYFAAQGHSAIRRSLHDGVTLPPLFRNAGLTTDIFDASDIAQCRMYRGARQTWRGFSKNAIEGLAAPRRIVIWTLLLAGGFVWPWIVLVMTLSLVSRGGYLALGIATAATVVSLATSLAVMKRAQQPWLAGFARPVGVLLLLVIQWQALLRHMRGRTPQWRGRSYPAT